jgi:gamma-aminobutyric acid type B receptor
VNSTWNSSVFMCWLRLVSLSVGYSVAYGAMLAKTWRVHMIFTNKNLRRVVSEHSECERRVNGE